MRRENGWSLALKLPSADRFDFEGWPTRANVHISNVYPAYRVFKGWSLTLKGPMATRLNPIVGQPTYFERIPYV